MSNAAATTGVFGETPPNLTIVANIDNINISVSATYRNRLNRSRKGPWVEPTGVGGKRWSSGFLHQIGKVSEHAATGLIAASALAAWVVVGIATGFPVWWENVLYITSSSVTVVMVFALQHTQARQQEVTQRKLDELLRAQPTADNRLIALEGASDDELEALTDLSQAHRERAFQTDAPPPPPIMDVSA
jgi:low affinity Fe/Cu permease